MKLWIGAAVAAIAVAPAYAGVTYNYEAPGKKTTTATFDYSGVETFDMQSLGNGQTFTTDFGTTGDPIVITGTYKGVDVYDADQYGGDDGSNYAVTFSSGGFLLELSTSDNSPLTYFGYWLSALDRGNQLEFLKDGSVVATITPADVIARTGACPASPYCGMPDGPFAGQNKGEPYAFINVYFDGGDSFDAVRFFESPQVGGYESDNHTVGYFVTKGGVPEPATWAMLITGFGLVGAAARRRRSDVVTA
jgi:hypothetical protein